MLLAKGDYPAELDIPLPFSLVSDDAARDRLRGHARLLVAVQHVRPGPQHLEVPDPRQAQDQDPADRVRLPARPTPPRRSFAALRAAGALDRQGRSARRGQVARRRQRRGAGRVGRGCWARPTDGRPDLEILGENMENSAARS